MHVIITEPADVNEPWFQVAKTLRRRALTADQERRVHAERIREQGVPLRSERPCLRPPAAGGT